MLLAWPDADTDWADDLEAVEANYADIARRVAARQRVLVVCRDPQRRERAQNRLSATGIRPEALRFACAPYDDTWIRDSGPLTVLDDGRPRLLDFRFNGWGGRYPAARDDALTCELHAGGAFGAVALERLDLVLEGGSIDTDGEGVLLTTTSCLLSPDRNPHLSRREIEARLRDALGVTRVLWLEHGALVGDDTGGHVDTLARFCDPQTIAYVDCEDPSDEHFESLRALRRQLETLHTPAGFPYRLIPLPLPAPLFDASGHRLPAGYVNFLILNGAVLVPTHRDPTDAIALDRLQQIFRPREVVGVDCTALLQQRGSLHCATLQLPQGVLP